MLGEERCALNSALQLAGRKVSPAASNDYSDIYRNKVVLSQSLQEHLNRWHEYEQELSK